MLAGRDVCQSRQISREHHLCVEKKDVLGVQEEVNDFQGGSALFEGPSIPRPESTEAETTALSCQSVSSVSRKRMDKAETEVSLYRCEQLEAPVRSSHAANSLTSQSLMV